MNMSNMNPFEMINSFMQGGGNPQSLINKAMGMMGGNNGQFGMISNLINMANGGNTKGIEQFARNICKSWGMDFDTSFNQFMSNIKK